MAQEHGDAKPGVTSPMESAASTAGAGMATQEGIFALFGGDEELVRELAGLFLEDAAAMMEVLRSGIAGADAQRVNHAAHALKGSVGNFGDARASQLCAKLELMGKRGDLSGASKTLAELEPEMTRVLGVLATITRGKQE